jgi:YesN/AraC family two-component response regulator
MINTSLDDFYQRNAATLPEGINRDIGHFNVFDTEKLFDKATGNRIMTGSTTTEIISNRIMMEAKILLKQTHWSISEIAYTLGYEDPAHFSKYFKKQTSFTPVAFRS